MALIPDAVKRSVYVDVCSRKFNIDSQILFERIGHTRGEMLAEEKTRNDSRRRREEEAAPSRPAEDTVPAVKEPHQVSVLSAPAGLEFDDVYLAPCEKELLGFIVESGDEHLAFDRDSEFYMEGESQTVAEFIDSALAGDDVQFANGIYRKVYDEYFGMYDRGLTQEQIRNRLLNSTDREIALVTADLLEDKYIITVENYINALTSKSTMLVMYVPKSVMAYQSRRIEKMLTEYDAKLESAGDDVAAQMDILKVMDGLNKARKNLNNRLGRV